MHRLLYTFEAVRNSAYAKIEIDGHQLPSPGYHPAWLLEFSELPVQKKILMMSEPTKMPILEK